MPEYRRAALLDLASQYGFTVVADDVYQLLPHTTEQDKGAESPGSTSESARVPLPMSVMQAQSASEGVRVPPPNTRKSTFMAAGLAVSLGSFSKLLFPGLRVGWIHAHPEVVARIACRGVVRSGGCQAHFTSGIAMTAIENGDFEALLPKVRAAISERMDAFCVGLRKGASSGGFEFEFTKPQVRETCRGGGCAGRVGWTDGPHSGPGAMDGAMGGAGEGCSHGLTHRLGHIYGLTACCGCVCGFGGGVGCAPRAVTLCGSAFQMATVLTRSNC